MSKKNNASTTGQSTAGTRSVDDPAKAGMLSGPKTQLALGAAATLGIMLLYRMGKKTLATQDPESHLAIEKVKAALKESANERRKESRRPREGDTERRENERRSKVRDTGES